MSRRARLPYNLFDRPRPFICYRCQQRRSISQTFLKTVQEGKQQWAQRAEEIQAGKRQTMLSILEERGLVKALAGDRQEVDKMLTNERIAVYCGIDPTAPSLHVGHLVPMMALFWMYLCGFEAISLIGGSTAKIGDPTWRASARDEMTTTERKSNIVCIHYQIKKLWGNVEKLSRQHGFGKDRYMKHGLLQNGNWWNSTPFTEVVRLMGKGFRLGSMLSRDTVKTRMENGNGMSFAEFCYPIMQAWDWWELNQQRNCQLQIGGEDQFGNIVAGMDAVNYVLKSHPDAEIRAKAAGTDIVRCGLTTPLITTASGEKFGKSAGNAVWLDQNHTSLFDLYRFFVGTADADVERYLKLFTFFPLPEIKAVMEQHTEDPNKRIAQHTLARQFVELAHGYEAVRDAESQHQKFMNNARNPNLSSFLARTETTQQHQTPFDLAEPFQSSPQPPNSSMTNAPPHDKPPNPNNPNNYLNQRVNRNAAPNDPNLTTATTHITLPRCLIENQPLTRVLHTAGLVFSRSEGYRLIQNRGAYLGRRSSNRESMGDDLSFYPIKHAMPDATWSYVIQDHEGDPENSMEKEGEEGVLILRTGKWKVKVIRIVSDEKFATLNLPEPVGWREKQSELAAERARTPAPSRGSRSSGANADHLPHVLHPGEKIRPTDAEAARRSARRAALRHFEDAEHTHTRTHAWGPPSNARTLSTLTPAPESKPTLFPWEQQQQHPQPPNTNRPHPAPGKPTYPHPDTQTHLPARLRNRVTNPAYRAHQSGEERRAARRMKNYLDGVARRAASVRVEGEVRMERAERRRWELRRGLERLRRREGREQGGGGGGGSVKGA